MSTTYEPTDPRGLPPEAAQWIAGELRAIKEALERGKRYEALQTLHGEPSKVFGGMVVLADGTDWDPGSGAGLYRRSEDNTAWVFVG